MQIWQESPHEVCGTMLDTGQPLHNCSCLPSGWGCRKLLGSSSYVGNRCQIECHWRRNKRAVCVVFELPSPFPASWANIRSIMVNHFLLIGICNFEASNSSSRLQGLVFSLLIKRSGTNLVEGAWVFFNNLTLCHMCAWFSLISSPRSSFFQCSQIETKGKGLVKPWVAPESLNRDNEDTGQGSQRLFLRVRRWEAWGQTEQVLCLEGVFVHACMCGQWGHSNVQRWVKHSLIVERETRLPKLAQAD